MSVEHFFASESVTPGHPDKLCDAIADAIVDALLRQDTLASAEVECAVASGIVFLAARVAARASVDMSSIARDVLSETGYAAPGASQFDARRCSILTSLTDLPDSDRTPDEPVADEHMNAFGFACRDTPSLMPMPIVLAHRVARAFDNARSRGRLGRISPDTKVQVAVAYRDGRPVHVTNVSIICGGDPAAVDALQALLEKEVLSPAFAGAPLPLVGVTLVNPGGFQRGGGPATHPGLTGRKPGIDTYGEFSRQPQAALSGKDLGSIDRVGAYAARWAARNIVAAGLAERCEVHLCYAPGRAEPASLRVAAFDTGVRPDAWIAQRLADVADFRPGSLLARWRLRERIAHAPPGGFLRPLAAYGHVGRDDLDLPWEQTDLVTDLRP